MIITRCMSHKCYAKAQELRITKQKSPMEQKLWNELKSGWNTFLRCLVKSSQQSHSHTCSWQAVCGNLLPRFCQPYMENPGPKTQEWHGLKTWASCHLAMGFPWNFYAVHYGLGLLTKEFRDKLGLAPEDCTVSKTKAAAWEDTSHRPCSGIKYHGTCQWKPNKNLQKLAGMKPEKMNHFSDWRQRKGNIIALSFFASSKQQLSPTPLTGEHFGWSKLRIKEAGAWPLVCICFATLPFCCRRTIFRYGLRDLFLEVSMAKELDATSKISIHLDHLGPYVKAEWD